jgi:hypothetical protein
MNVFVPSHAEIFGSNPTQDMDVHLRFLCALPLQMMPAGRARWQVEALLLLLLLKPAGKARWQV